MKNVVVCLNIDRKSFNELRRVKYYVPDNETNITLLHIWDKKSYNYPSDMIVAFYPNTEQAEDIQREMKINLEEQFNSLDGHSSEHFNTQVFSSTNPKKETVGFLVENNSDLVICFSPEKGTVENFFHSSFTNFLNAHAPCDVLNLRIK
jgi:hypothetical protein